MDRTSQNYPGVQQNNWQAGQILEQEIVQPDKKVWWWHRLSVPSETGAQLTFLQREANRRARLLSTIVFYLLIVDILLIPATLFIPNHYVLYLCLFMLLMCIICALINRANKGFLASFMLVSLLELVLLAVIVSTHPFDVGNLPLYDLLIIAELFAASLLPMRSIFITAFINTIFIVGETFLQKTQPGYATVALHAYLQTQFYAALVRPVALQIIVGVVIFLWVRSTSQAIARADRAEMIAKLEHTLAEQKEQLEKGIQHILQTHAEVSNGNLKARAPLTQDNSLWPLANALNTLLTRFQRSYRAEQDLQHIQTIIPQLVTTMRNAEQSQRPLPSFTHTSTPLDPLLVYLSGKRLQPPQDMYFRE
jgi:large-conductance mechanosensitive channel